MNVTPKNLKTPGDDNAQPSTAVTDPQGKGVEVPARIESGPSRLYRIFRSRLIQGSLCIETAVWD